MKKFLLGLSLLTSFSTFAATNLNCAFLNSRGDITGKLVVNLDSEKLVMVKNQIDADTSFQIYKWKNSNNLQIQLIKGDNSTELSIPLKMIKKMNANEDERLELSLTGAAKTVDSIGLPEINLHIALCYQTGDSTVHPFENEQQRFAEDYEQHIVIRN